MHDSHAHSHCIATNGMNCILFFLFQILSESYLIHQKSAEYNNQNNHNLQNAQSVDSVADTTKGSIQSDKTEETDLSSTDLSVNSSASSNSPTGANESKTKKESGFLNKCKSIESLILINSNVNEFDSSTELFNRKHRNMSIVGIRLC